LQTIIKAKHKHKHKHKQIININPLNSLSYLRDDCHK
jgi:hypothetical protein